MLTLLTTTTSDTEIEYWEYSIESLDLNNAKILFSAINDTGYVPWSKNEWRH